LATLVLTGGSIHCLGLNPASTSTTSLLKQQLGVLILIAKTTPSECSICLLFSLVVGLVVGVPPITHGGGGGLSCCRRCCVFLLCIRSHAGFPSSTTTIKILHVHALHSSLLLLLVFFRCKAQCGVLSVSKRHRSDHSGQSSNKPVRVCLVYSVHGRSVGFGWVGRRPRPV
jgi:hypothetical protein